MLSHSHVVLAKLGNGCPRNVLSGEGDKLRSLLAALRVPLKLVRRFLHLLIWERLLVISLLDPGKETLLDFLDETRKFLLALDPLLKGSVEEGELWGGKFLRGLLFF